MRGDPDEHTDGGAGQPVGDLAAVLEASQATSRSIRCCGSRYVASRGEIPKKPASNRSIASRNPPRRGKSSPSRSRSSHRESGIAPTASTPSRRVASSPRALRAGEPAAHAHDRDRLAEARPGGCSGCAGASGTAAPEGTRERVDRGMVVDQRGESFRPSHSSSSAASRTARSEPMPKPSRGARTSTSSAGIPSGSATLAASQAAIASRDSEGEEALARLPPRPPSDRDASTPLRDRATRPGTPRDRRGAGPSRSRSGAVPAP